MTQLPMIHLNGTNGQVLAGEYAKALGAVDAAITTLNELTVHERDYYPIGDRAFIDARNEHHERLTQLVNMRRDLSHIYHSIVDAVALRLARTATWDDFDPGDRNGAFRND